MLSGLASGTKRMKKMVIAKTNQIHFQKLYTFREHCINILLAH